MGQGEGSPGAGSARETCGARFPVTRAGASGLKVAGRPPGLAGVAGLWPSKSARKGRPGTAPAILRAGRGGASGAPGSRLTAASAGSCHSARGLALCRGRCIPPRPRGVPLFLGRLGTWRSGFPRRLVANRGAFRWARWLLAFLLGRRWGAPWTQHPSVSLSEVSEQGPSSRHHSQPPLT